ncbi:WD40 repeat domain-containing protein [Embleya sp. NPDC056575]|uniref:WD40 repeat domain-containing protein n=2 Tax=unclassified Embleya TaxID=2699296 RepID=UPI0036CC397D
MTVMATRTGLGWEHGIDDVPSDVAIAGGLCVVAGVAGGVRLLDAATGRFLARIVVPGGVYRAEFSPDGTVVALAGPTGYALWRVTDGALVLRTPGLPARCAWSADGRCAVSFGGVVRVYAPGTGTESWPAVDGRVRVDDVVWVDGGALAVALGGEVHMYGPRGRTNVWTWPVPVRLLAGTPGGAWLCAAGDVPGVQVRGAGGTHEDLDSVGDLPAVGLALDAGGGRLAVEDRAGLTVWDLAARGGRVRPRPRRLPAQPRACAPRWRPAGGGLLATSGGDGMLVVWDVRAGSARKAATPLARRHVSAPVAALAWHGTDALLFADRAGRVGARWFPELTNR